MLKKLCICLVSVLLLSAGSSVSAIDLVDTCNMNLSLYGFLKGDMTILDNPVNSNVAARYATTSDGGDGATVFTAMHSRFGLKMKGPELNHGLGKVGGILEFDFFDPSSRNQMKFRVRHAALTMTGESHKLLFGQYWDLFSPIGPTTLNTNGYWWQTGNMGFRRAQFRGAWMTENFEIAGSLSDPTSDPNTIRQWPLGMARAGLIFGEKKDYKVGISFVGGSGKYRFDYDDDGTLMPGENNVTTWGVCVDWNLNLKKGFGFKGEFHSGDNLGIFLSRSGVYLDTASFLPMPEMRGVKTNAGWLELVYKADPGTVWVGFATERLEGDNIASERLENTYAFILGGKYGLGAKTALGAEYTYFNSKFKDVDDSGKANQILVSWIYSF